MSNAEIFLVTCFCNLGKFCGKIVMFIKHNDSFNPFAANNTFMYPLKTSENPMRWVNENLIVVSGVSTVDFEQVNVGWPFF